MKEEREKLRDLLNSHISINVELGMTLMASIGVPKGVRWTTYHLQWLASWLENLAGSSLIGADIEEKTISYGYPKSYYKVVFYEEDLQIREFHLVGGGTFTALDKVRGLLQKVQRVSFVRAPLYELREVLFQLKSIIYLDLSQIYWSKAAEKVVYLTNLKELYLRWNNIEILPKMIGNLQNLEILDLRKNTLRKIPVSFWTLKQLKTLYLGDVVHWEESSEDWALERLETLELWGTRTVPDWVWLRMPNLKQLVWVKTSVGQLVKIGDTIGALKKLERLVLDVRTLSYPSAIGELEQLKSLEIYNDIPHSFATLPKEWAQLSNLKVLKLRGIFEDLPLEWAAMTQLEELFLNNKSEKVVPLVYELKNLQRLTLFIGLQTIIDSKIATLVHLKWIELKNIFRQAFSPKNLDEQRIKLRKLFPKVKIRY